MTTLLQDNSVAMGVTYLMGKMDHKDTKDTKIRKNLCALCVFVVFSSSSIMVTKKAANRLIAPPM
jgi:hypothetical protein